MVAGRRLNPPPAGAPPDDGPLGALRALPDVFRYTRHALDLVWSTSRPLTIALAGLPTSEGRLFSEDQIDGRGMTIKMAYRVARNVAKECLGGS